MGSSPSQIVIERVLPGFMVLILLSVISVLAPKPLYGAQALVYADFTVGAIAAYSGPSGHSNDYAVTFAEQNITNFRVSQDCAYWGCGDGATQGNDFAVTVTMSQTGKSDFSFPATFNWVRNNSGTIKLAGLVMADGVGNVNDGYTIPAGDKKTYVVVLPNFASDFALEGPGSGRTAKYVSGSANFGKGDMEDFADTVAADFGVSSLEATKSLTKVNGATPPTNYLVSSGDVLEYTVSVANTGGQSGTTTLTETVPDNTSYSGSSEGWTVASGNYTQDVTVAAGATGTAKFTVTVGTLGDGVLSIANTVASGTGACSSCTVTNATDPRLSISKSVPSSLPVGGTGSYTITLENKGGSATSGVVTFTDTLPTGLSFNAQTAGAPELACTAAGQVVTCTGSPDIAVAGTESVTYSVDVAGSASGTLINGVLLTALGGDPRTPANDAVDPSAGNATQGSDKLSAKSTQSVTSGASLATTKSLTKVNGATPPTNYLVSSGDVLEYTVSVSNTGGQSGTTTLTETVPDNTSYSGSSEGWAVASGNYTQDVTVAAGATGTAKFTVTVGTLGVGVLSIANTVASGTGACSSCTVTTLVAQPKITLIKTASDPADNDSNGVDVGDVITYTYVATNSGNVTLTNVSIAETQADFTGTGTLPSPAYASGGSDQDSDSATDDLAVGESVTWTATYALTQADVNAGFVENQAKATGSSPSGTGDVTDVSDDDGTNASDKTRKSLLPTTKPTLTKTATLTTDADSSGDITAGDTLTYTIKLLNDGAVTITSNTLSDNLSGFVSAGISCTGSSSVASLAPSDSCTLTGTYVVTQANADAGSLVNTATSSSTKGSDTLPRSATLTLTVNQDPALTLIKTASDPADNDSNGVDVDDVITYTYVATNSGNVTLTNVSIAETQADFTGTGTLPSPAYASGGSDQDSDSATDDLAVGESVTWTATYALTQADVNAGFVENRATATGSSPSGTGDVTDVSDDDGTNASDKTRKSLLPTTKPTLTKTATLTTDADSSGDITAGDTLTYTIKLLNDGAVTITSNTLSDNLSGFVSAGISCTGSSSVASLAPSDSCTLTGTYVVTQANADAGSLVNTATSSSTKGSDTLPRSATLTLTVNQDPALQVVKTATTANGTALNDVVSYTITVKNIGNVTLNEIEVTDTLTDYSGASLTLTTGPSFVGNSGSSAAKTLAPQETSTYTATYKITQAAIDAGGLSNTATANGKGPANQTVTDVSDTGDETKDDDGDGDATKDPTKTALAQTAALEVTKTVAAPDGVDLGDLITYTITVKNTGTVTISGIEISDSLTDALGEKLSLTSGPTFVSSSSESAEKTLVAGELATYTATFVINQQAIDAGGVKNIAVATGTDPSGKTIEDTSDDGNDSDDNLVDDPTELGLTKEPSQTISKRVSANADEDGSGDISLGDTLTYTVTATNIGNLTLTDMVVSDEKLSPATVTCASVEPGKACSLVGTYQVSQAQVDAGFIDNVASVASAEIAETTETNLRVPVPRRPALAITKTLNLASTNEIKVGDELSYTVLATNVGNLTLADVTVSDSKIQPTSVVCAALLPKTSCELTGLYQVTQADKDQGYIENVGSVIADELPKPLQTTLITPLVKNSQPTLTKAVSRLTDRDESGGISTGDLLTFTVSLLNDGDATLTQVLVSDDHITPSSTSCAKLLPGSTCQLVGSYKVTQDDVDAGNLVNIATASMKEHPEGRRAVLNTAIDQVTGLGLTKDFIEHLDTDENGVMSPGDDLSYRITAENTGNVTLLNVVVSDKIVQPAEAICAELAPGASCVLSGRYTVLAADIAAGVVVNQATATADNLADPVVVETKVPLEQNQKPTLSKALISNDDRDGNGSVTPGDVLTYRVTLLNDGNTTLTDVVVTDPLIEPASKTCAALLPGKRCDLEGTYLVTLADQQAGKIKNFAEATTKEVPGPRQVILETLVVEPLADLSLTKTIDLLEDRDGSTTLTPGDVVEFVITLTNEVTDIPTGDATGVVISDKLQSRYGYLSDDGGGLYDPTSGDWVVGTVPLGESRRLRINALVLTTGSFTNSAEVIASDSIDPDSFPGNDDGDQDEDDEAAAPPSPAVGLSVEVGTPVPRGNGNYTIAMSYVLENTGIVGLCELKLLDDLGAVFGPENVVSVTTPVTAGTLVPNVKFDGVTDLNLLVSDCDNQNASRLPADSDAVVKIVIEVTPTPGVTIYEHNAQVQAKSSDIGNPSVQIPIVDLSTAGPEPDPNKNNNAEEAEPNRIELVLLPGIDVDLGASVPVPQESGRYLTVLNLTVVNEGNLSLTDIDLSLPLAEVFLSGYQLAGPIETDRGSIVVNNQFDGVNDIGLFDADPADGISSHLAVGELVNVAVPVIFESDSDSAFELFAAVTAQASVGPVTDRTLDDVAAGSDNATVISTTPIGILGVALSAGPAAETIVAKNPSQRCEAAPCRASLTLQVANVGNLALSEIQIEPLLSGPDGLPEGTIVEVTDLTGSIDLSQVNTSLIGKQFVIGSDDRIQLLAGTETLAIGGAGTIRLVLTFTLPAGTLFERFEIAALASGSDTAGIGVSDLSNNGSSVDPDGDGPNDDGIPTPIVISSQSIIGVLAQAKSDPAGNALKLLDAGDPAQAIESRTLTYGAGFQVEVANLGNTTLESVEVVNSLVGTFPTLAADPDQPLGIVPGSLSVTKTVSEPSDSQGFSQKRGDKGAKTVRRKTDLSSAINLNFDGITDVNLVDPGEVTLALGETIVISYDLEIEIDYADTAAIEELQQQKFETQIVANGTDAVSGQTISDLSDDAPGLDLDALDFNALREALDSDGDFDPNEAGENTPTALQFPTAIQGKVCLDVNADGLCSDVDTPLENWIVNVFETGGQADSSEQAGKIGVAQKPLLNAAGEPTSVTTDANGYYSIASAPTGSYRFEFMSPFGGVAGIVNGTGFSLKVLNVPTLVLDPRGLIYDSVTNEPIGGVMLTMTDALGSPLPGACFAVPDQQNQITGSASTPGLLGLPAGAYEFSIQPGAAPECPVESTEYKIAIDPETLPEGYTLSNLRPPESGVLVTTVDQCSANGVNVDVDLETERCEVSAAVGASGQRGATAVLSFLRNRRRGDRIRQ